MTSGVLHSPFLLHTADAKSYSSIEYPARQAYVANPPTTGQCSVARANSVYMLLEHVEKTPTAKKNHIYDNSKLIDDVFICSFDL